jgi:nicotinate-nucleotide adenylyltransferase
MQLAPPIGIFGGTFDPIHNGHIFPVIEGAKKANIKKVALMPCYIPSHKNPAVASTEDRLNMVKLICADNPLFYPDSRDINRGKPTFSVDSLKEIREAMPTTPLCFFIGSDSLQNLVTWHNWPTLFSLCHFIVCERNENVVDDAEDNSLKLHAPKLQALLDKRQTFTPMALHNSLAGYIYIANTQTLMVSSTQIRQILAKKQSTESFLPLKILDYIQQHKLYQTSTDFC